MSLARVVLTRKVSYKANQWVGNHLSALISCEVIFKASWLDSFYSTNIRGGFFLCRVGDWRFCGVATSHGCAIMRDCYCFLVLIIQFGMKKNLTVVQLPIGIARYITPPSLKKIDKNLYLSPSSLLLIHSHPPS